MKITISGNAGSGKSTVAKMIAKKLEYKHYSVGDLMREIATARGVSMVEISNIAESDKSIDEELDAKQKTLGKKEDNFVIDSRLGFYFIPDSFKIFLAVDVKESAKRIFEDSRGEEKFGSIEEGVELLQKRMDSEKIRYKEYYGIDFPNPEDFDLMIDTTELPVKEVVEKILTLLANLDNLDVE